VSNLYIGTCSWKYPSWEGLVYSSAKGIDYLQEYAKNYNAVEVDQWFWSLFAGQQPKLPAAKDVQEYRRAVPETFRFTIKAPNSLTLTHYHSPKPASEMNANDHFLSPPLWSEFRERIAPLHDVTGPVILQFEYLNRQKMASQKLFLQELGRFAENAGAEWAIGIETRNGNYLNEAYFAFLSERKLVPVLLQGYWMPSVDEVYQKYRLLLRQAPAIVMRLHGPDRGGIEKETGGEWNRIVHDRGEELSAIVRITLELRDAGIDVYLNVNNHYEGSAPITIDRLKKLLAL
jgi:uncharacterized protein YecE (DUF72 family)